MRQQAATYNALLQGEGEQSAVAQEMRATLLLQVQALKNTWLRGRDPKQFERYTAEFDARAQDLRLLRASLDRGDSRLTSEEQATLKQFDAGWAGYPAAWPVALAAYGGPEAGNVAAGDAAMSGKDRDAVTALDALADSLRVRRQAVSGQLTV